MIVIKDVALSKFDIIILKHVNFLIKHENFNYFQLIKKVSCRNDLLPKTKQEFLKNVKQFRRD